MKSRSQPPTARRARCIPSRYTAVRKRRKKSRNSTATLTFLSLIHIWPEDFLKAPKKLSIVYEDENLLLLDKKPGLIVHPDENYHFDSLIARVQHYLYRCV